MDCRHLLAPAAAGLMLVAGAHAHAGETDALPVLHVTGGDFPALVLEVPDAPTLHGPVVAPGCDRIRARRVDELAPGWRERVDRVELECEDTLADDAWNALTAVTARAMLKPDRVQLAGLPVAEVRLMDSEVWGDHQYVLATPFEIAAPAVKRLVEEACLARTLAEEVPGTACTMLTAEDGLYLPVSEVSGIWVHADPDDAGRTRYVEAWAD